MALKPDRYTTHCQVPKPTYATRTITKYISAKKPIDTPSDCYTPRIGTTENES